MAVDPPSGVGQMTSTCVPYASPEYREGVDASSIPQPFREDLLRYLFATSKERARIISELSEKKPPMADLLIDLEADDDLRARFEIALLRRSG